MIKRGSYINIKDLRPIIGKLWWMSKFPSIYWAYFCVKMELRRIRYKTIFAPDHKVYEKDRLLFWRKQRDTGAIWM